MSYTRQSGNPQSSSEAPDRMQKSSTTARNQRCRTRREQSDVIVRVVSITVLVSWIVGLASSAVITDNMFMEDAGAAAACASILVVNIDDDRDLDEPEFNPPSYAEVVLRAQLVLYGRIRDKFYDQERYGAQGYSAEMQVYCSLKGQRTEAVVNISNAGKLNGTDSDSFFSVVWRDSGMFRNADFRGTRGVNMVGIMDLYPQSSDV